MTIYLDFDGTIVEHAYPYIGDDNPNAFKIIKKLQENDHNIILNTYRADIDKKALDEALAYINNPINKLKPILEYSINKINPLPWDWKEMKKNKVIFIDDISPNIPLINTSTGYMVYWTKIADEFKNNNIF